MRSLARSLVLSLLALLVAASLVLPALAAAKPSTFTGEIGDAMCGAKHAGGNAAECTRSCVKEGSAYALVVGDKVYKLKGGDAAMLDKLAGAKATVTGTLEGDTITVASVAPAK
ncbi:MAG TPA: hypothetical protein VLT85_13820 [Terriglobales bacterium]|nr:hypothetical protein [Terriglobales bacterium]